MIMASERELIRKAIRNKRSSLSMLKHNLGNDDRNDAKIALKQAELKALDAYDEWGAEMDLITIAAVRYAVGRATYMTEEVASTRPFPVIQSSPVRSAFSITHRIMYCSALDS